ncbi:hypothetical protein BDV06DRAFT_223913 [Aspergillus oleicola]
MGPTQNQQRPTNRHANILLPTRHGRRILFAILAATDAMMCKRVPMAPVAAANTFAPQTASGSALLVAPNAWWLVPWYAQRVMEVVRGALGGRDVVKIVEDIIEGEIVKRQ